MGIKKGQKDFANQPSDNPLSKNYVRRTAKPTDPDAEINLPNGYGVRDRGNGQGIQFRLESDKVVDYVARVVVKYNLNFEAAVAAMSPKKLTDEQIARQAIIISHSPKVQAKLQQMYTVLGIDDEAFKKYWSVLWGWMLQGDRPRAVAAAKLLGSIFGITEKADETKKVQPLAIKNFEAGLAKMGITDASANPTGFGSDTIEEENEENG